jgi:hypothetical protein
LVSHKALVLFSQIIKKVGIGGIEAIHQDFLQQQKTLTIIITGLLLL